MEGITLISFGKLKRFLPLENRNAYVCLPPLDNRNAFFLLKTEKLLLSDIMKRLSFLWKTGTLPSDFGKTKGFLPLENRNASFPWKNQMPPSSWKPKRSLWNTKKRYFLWKTGTMICTWCIYIPGMFFPLVCCFLFRCCLYFAVVCSSPVGSLIRTALRRTACTLLSRDRERRHTSTSPLSCWFCVFVQVAEEGRGEGGGSEIIMERWPTRNRNRRKQKWNVYWYVNKKQIKNINSAWLIE